MLRPATPLTVVFLAAFVLTLLPVLSAPVIKSIFLCNFDDVRYGVFGYCQDDRCFWGIGYAPPTPDIDADFTVAALSTRHTLTAILVVHPVACLFQLLSLILALVAHFHSPSHSSRYLLALIIFMLPTLLITLLAFLVDILLFIPKLSWAGWLVLVAVIFDVVAGIMLCAMRRTLVSRKARKKRIAENADMNGEISYQPRQVVQVVNHADADSPPPMHSQPTFPMVNGAADPDKLPQHATFEQHSARKVSDDRVPLYDYTDTATTGSSVAGGRASMEAANTYIMGSPARRGGSMNSGREGRPYGTPRDEFGNPLPPSSALGQNPDRPSSRSSGRGRGGMRGGYGRGGPPGPYGGYGRGGPPPQGRGGMGPAFSAGAAAGALAGDMGRGRGPPPGYSNESYQMQDRPPMNGAYGQRRQSPGPPSAPGYGARRQSPGPPSATGYNRGPPPPPGSYSSGQRSPGPPSAPGYGQGPPSEDGQYARAESPPPMPGQDIYARAESPPPLGSAAGVTHHHGLYQDAVEMEAPHGAIIGQAIEMDERTGSPAHSPGPAQTQFTSFHRTESPLRQGSAVPSSPIIRSPAQEDVYVPARAAWQSNVATGNATHQAPAELAGSTSRMANATSPLQNVSQAPGTYYEDVDPRFSQDHYGHGHADASNIGVAIDTPPHPHGHTGGYAY